MLSKALQLQDRTKRFAISIIRFCRGLPRGNEQWIISGQLIRSATSVAANYRAACRARSRAEFIAKVGIVVEEADETVFWLEVWGETQNAGPGDHASLLREAQELLAIFASSQKTMRLKGKISK
ncbi:MAG: four helix bundle protein [Ignavibacteria bacterium]|nr:four helix bundle protein [Ignavibacteria bacterium]